MALDSNIYIDMNLDGLKEAIISIIGGIPQRINSRRFQNNMTDFDSKDDVMTLLVHLGYPGYDTDQIFILPALLVELKYDKAAEGAIKQIKDKMKTQRYDKICG